MFFVDRIGVHGSGVLRQQRSTARADRDCWNCVPRPVRTASVVLHIYIYITLHIFSVHGPCTARTYHTFRILYASHRRLTLFFIHCFRRLQRREDGPSSGKNPGSPEMRGLPEVYEEQTYRQARHLPNLPYLRRR